MLSKQLKNRKFLTGPVRELALNSLIPLALTALLYLGLSSCGGGESKKDNGNGNTCSAGEFLNIERTACVDTCEDGQIKPTSKDACELEMTCSDGQILNPSTNECISSTCAANEVIDTTLSSPACILTTACRSDADKFVNVAGNACITESACTTVARQVATGGDCQVCGNDKVRSATLDECLDSCPQGYVQTTGSDTCEMATVCGEGQTLNRQNNTCVTDPPPGPLTNLMAFVSHESVKFSWANPADTDFDHVEITWNGGSQTLSPAESGAANADNTYRLTGLTNGQSYAFELKAVDTAGGESSLVSITRTPDSFTVSLPPNAHIVSATLSGVSGELPEFYDPDNEILVDTTKATLDMTNQTWQYATAIDLNNTGANTIQITSQTSGGHMLTQKQLSITRLADLSGNTGTGTDFSASRGIVLNSAGTTAYVIDWSLKAVFSVDLSNGDRTIISNSGTGDGTNFSFPYNTVLNPTGTIAYVVDNDVDAVFSVDLSNGDRTIVSNSGRGTGTNFNSLLDIVLNSAGTTAYVVDNDVDAVFSVDLSDGDRTIVSTFSDDGDNTNDEGTGPFFDQPEGIVLNSTGTIAYVVDASVDAIIAVDLSNGDRTIVSTSTTGVGTNFNRPRYIVLNPTGTTAYVTDRGLDAVVSVDLSDGDRTVVSDDDTGSGIDFDQPEGIVLNPAGTIAYVVDESLDAVIAVDLVFGDRFIVSE